MAAGGLRPRLLALISEKSLSQVWGRETWSCKGKMQEAETVSSIKNWPSTFKKILVCKESAIISHHPLGTSTEEQENVGSWHNRHLCHPCWPCWWYHRHRLSDTKWQCSLLPSFYDFRTSIFNKLGQQLNEKLLSAFPFISYIYFCYSIPIDRAREVSPLREKKTTTECPPLHFPCTFSSLVHCTFLVCLFLQHKVLFRRSYSDGPICYVFNKVPLSTVAKQTMYQVYAITQWNEIEKPPYTQYTVKWKKQQSSSERKEKKWRLLNKKKNMQSL